VFIVYSKHGITPFTSMFTVRSRRYLGRDYGPDIVYGLDDLLNEMIVDLMPEE